MVLGRNTSLPALLSEIPQFASLIVFLVMLFPVPEESFREMAVPLVSEITLLCTVTVFAELRLIAFCAPLILLEVAFTLGPALWKESPELTWEMLLLDIVPP